MIGRPLMVMPFASAASRAPVTGAPMLLGPSPEISMTRRSPRYGFFSNSGIAKLIAPEIEVREPRRTGVFMISLATASADSGPSITRQGTMIFWSLDADHSRSEEHTSELQSHSDLVCRLLLEKKKKKKKT